MSPMLSTLLFAAAAAAEVTTSIWMPSGYGADEVGYYGSVIEVNDDLATIAIVYDDDTDTEYIGVYDNTPVTVTVGPTYFESVVTTTDSYDDLDMTVSLGCSMATRLRAKPTCTYSMNGAAVFSSYCSDALYSDEVITSTDVYTYTAFDTYPATTETVIETYNYADYAPEFCTEGTTIPESYAIDTITLSRTYVETYQVIITAGEEKLAATARSSISGTEATATGTGSQDPSASGTAASGASGASGNASGSQTAAAAAGTGAAPLITAAPVLAGLGVALAAML